TYHHLVRTACMAAGFTPTIAHYADEWDTGTALVAHGFGIILVPRLARLAADSPVVRIPLHREPAPARRIIAATRRGGREHPVTTHALRTITTIAPDLDPAPHEPAADTSHTDTIDESSHRPGGLLLASSTASPDIALPALSLVLLVGDTGSGKSTFAAQNFGRFEVVSSDHCRALVSDDEADQ